MPPLHSLHQRMKCDSFIFLFIHHSFLQTVMYWSMETLMITRLKCSLNPESSHCLTFQLSPIRSLNCLSVKTCLSFIFLITDNVLHYYIQKVMFQLSLKQSLNWLSVKTCSYKKIYIQKVMYCSTDNNNDVRNAFWIQEAYTVKHFYSLPSACSLNCLGVKTYFNRKQINREKHTKEKWNICYVQMPHPPAILCSDQVTKLNWSKVALVRNSIWFICHLSI